MQMGFIWCRNLSNAWAPQVRAQTGQLGSSLQQSAPQKHLRMRRLLHLAGMTQSRRNPPCLHRCLPNIYLPYMISSQRPQVYLGPHRAADQIAGNRLPCPCGTRMQGVLLQEHAVVCAAICNVHVLDALAAPCHEALCCLGSSPKVHPQGNISE